MDTLATDDECSNEDILATPASSSLSDIPLTLTLNNKDDGDAVPSHPPPSMPPPPPPPTSSTTHGFSKTGKSRREIVATIYQLLNVYEKRRRNSIENQYESSRLYWDSIMNILRRGIKEVMIVERAIRGQIAADQAYTKHMIACANSCCLISDGDLLHDEEMESNGKELGNQHVDCVDKEGNILSRDIRELESEQNLITSRDNVVHVLATSFHRISKKYNVNIKKLNDNYLTGLESLGYSLDDALLTVQCMSQNILLELKAGDLNSKECWKAYSKAVEPNSEGDFDVWLYESRYRLSVACLATCWKKCSEEMSKLFRFVKDIEVQRQKTIQSLLKQLCQEREYHWHSLPSTSHDIICWVAERSENDQKHIEKDLTTHIHSEAIRLKALGEKNNEEDVSNDNSQDLSAGLKVLNFDEGESKGRSIELASPVVSELLSTIKVLEKRNQSFVAKFKRTMAISTVDGFLHFFDISESNGIFSSKKSATLSDVFNSFLPEIDVPSLDSIKSQEKNISKEYLKKRQDKVKRNFSPSLPLRSWHDLLKPSASLYLPNCKLHLTVDKKSGECVAELTETIANVGAAKLFARNFTRLYYLRAENSDMLSKWVTNLNISTESA